MVTLVNGIFNLKMSNSGENISVENRFNDEHRSTITSREQITLEHNIEKFFNEKPILEENINLEREKHISFLKTSLLNLSTAYECLDSSRPWLIYWTFNAARLLNFDFNHTIKDNVIEFLIRCRNDTGGFGGGPGQYSHLAPTYAAVNTLCIIGTEKAYEAINKETLKKFLWSIRESNGAFCMHVDGEIDIRGAYCAISTAKLLNFSREEEKKLFEGTVNWISTCQTYEGGMGGTPFLEAHGGYSFCGIAALALLGSTGNCDLNALLRWTVNRQMKFEGGFQGRTNKLVDGCYSFWQGAIIPIVQALLKKNDSTLQDLLRSHLFDRTALQAYILLCCQYPKGGLIDKPGKPPDLYHTCYTLSGLSVAQHTSVHTDLCVYGNADNELFLTHPLHNIPPKAVWEAYIYFKSEQNSEFMNNADNNVRT